MENQFLDAAWLGIDGRRGVRHVGTIDSWRRELQKVVRDFEASPRADELDAVLLERAFSPAPPPVQRGLYPTVGKPFRAFAARGGRQNRASAARHSAIRSPGRHDFARLLVTRSPEPSARSALQAASRVVESHAAVEIRPEHERSA